MSCADAQALLRIASALVDPARPRETLIGEAVALRELLEQRAGLGFDSAADLGAGQTALDSGLALSPLKAALCARECFRTIVFIKGLHAAIGAAAVSGRAVRVLYAGCGPFATLVLPLMALLPPARVVYTLLDIHQQALEQARALIDGLGLSERVDAYVHADATRYRIGAAAPDLIVSETMNAALRDEPQVAIMRHLAAQAPQALLVPARVTVRACLLHLAKEFAPPLAGPGATLVEPQRDRIDLGEVFALDADGIRAWNGTGDDSLPAGAVRIPAPLAPRYRAMLLTHIQVHGPHVLNDFDSSLNLPQPFPGKPLLRGGECLRWRYRLGPRPGLELVAAPA